MQIIIKFLNFIKNNKGSGPIVATVILLPLLAGLIFGTTMYAQMANVQNICEEAARAGARYYASHYGELDAKDNAIKEAQDVIKGSINITPVKRVKPQQEGELSGCLEKIGGKFYINGICLKTKGPVRKELESLVGQNVTVYGYMKNYSILKTEAACADPIPMKVRSGFRWARTEYYSHYTVGNIPAVMNVKEKIYAPGGIVNIGTKTWHKNNVGATYHWYNKDNEIVEWNGCISYLNKDISKEDEFQWDKQLNPIKIKTPTQGGRYFLKMDMITFDENPATWFSKKCSIESSKYLIFPVYILQNDENVKGTITIDEDEIWLDDIVIIEPQDETAEYEVNFLIGEKANLWGKYEGQKARFWVNDVQKDDEGLTFNDQVDVEINEEKDHAFCRVIYHYPVPIRTLLRLIHLEDEPLSREIAGTAYFKLGESET